VLAHPVAVAADVDDVAVMDEPVDRGTGHDVVTDDLAPLLEALVAGEHGGGALVAPAHELAEEHGPGAGDGQVADLVDDEERGEDQGLEPLGQPAGGLPVHAESTYLALLATKQALGWEPQEAWVLAHYELGKLYQERGDTAKATDFYDRFLAIWKDGDPDLVPLADAKKRLHSLSGPG
jgi:tetratricopeptide (TPR) repeat protein